MSTNKNHTIWALPDRSLRKNRTHKSPKQPAVLAHYPHVILYVYQSRYATVHHIYQRFKNRIKSLRTAQYQLARLVDLGLLKTMDVTATGPNFPHVYVATGRGISYIRKTFSLELTEGREEASSLPSITHELFLTALELVVYQTIQSRADLKLHFTERRYQHQSKQLIYGNKQVLKPDAGFLITVDRPEGQPPAYLFYFVELDNGTERLNVIDEKYRKYLAWQNTDHGRQYLHDIYARHGAPNPKPNYRLLVVARHNKDQDKDHVRMTDLLVRALELPEAIRKRIWFTTIDQLIKHEHVPQPLLEPIWFRLADTSTWIRDYQAYAANLPTGPGHTSEKHQRQYVAARLERMPQHPALPQPITS